MSASTSVLGPARARCRRLIAAAAAAAALVLGPGVAPAAAGCPERNPSYTGACGPTFVLPGWGDAGGWTDPDQYETIQLADVDGDGADELLGRTPTGLTIHDFDTSLGHWRPQVDNNDRPIVLTLFANPPPLSSVNPPGSGRWWNGGGYPPGTDWTLPQYYDTIQAANIDKDPGEEVLARSGDGVIVFKFTPSGPGKGTWKQLTTSGPLNDSARWGEHPSYYTTMGTGDFDGDGDAELFARGSAGPTVLDWNGSSWRTVANVDGILSDADQGKNPAYYTSLQAADLDGDKRDELVMRDFVGVTGVRFGDRFSVKPLPIGDDGRTFGDRPGRDCPFYGGGPCLGTAPSYYGTLQFADVNGDGRAELFGRSPGGLRGYLGVTGGRLEPLTALADGDGYNDAKQWETIQFADINGDGKRELLARDKDGLNAWSFDRPGNLWTKLTPTTPLALADDPWGDDRSYYSTIQTGDVDGDGREDVIARGPYGIRTWFYDRRGSGGWESYLPYGYQEFPTAGQKAAFATLNAIARSHGYLTASQNTIRDVWTGTTEPTADLKELMGNLASIAGCPANNDALPQYQSCRLPDGAGGFTGADWTAVVNGIVAELYYAMQVMDHFHSPVNGVREIWRNLLIEQLAELPTITQRLKLQAAADMRAEYDAKELFTGMFEIAGTVVGLIPVVGHAGATAFEFTSEVMSMIPSASEALTEELDSTLLDLQTKFATGVSQASLAMANHSQIIRQDAGLLTLVGQLRARGTWTLDPVAMESSGQQGFALWLYKTLLPEMYVRYAVTNCYTRSVGDDCEQANSSRAHVGAPDVAKGADSPSFSVIGPLPSTPNSGFQIPHPCWRPLFTVCHYDAVPDDIAEKVWGPVADSCIYDGSTSAAAWTFGCNLGVDPLKSVLHSPIAGETWDFRTYPGDFWVCSFCPNPPTPETARSARAVAGRATTLRPRGARAVVPGRTTLQMRGTITVPRAFRLPQARVTVERLLDEGGRAGELADAGTRLPLRLSQRGARTFVSHRRGGSRVQVRLRRQSPRSLAFRLDVSGRGLDLPDACSGIRRGVDLADSPIFLHTRLRIRDGRGRARPISFAGAWHCETNRRGAVHRLVLRQPKPLIPSRGGLAVRVHGPRVVTAGRLATYRIVVRNRRPTTAYDVRVQATLPRGFTARRHHRARRDGDLVRWNLARLRPGRSKVLHVRVRVPASAAGRGRVAVRAHAIDTRPAGGRFATRVRAVPAPRR